MPKPANLPSMVNPPPRASDITANTANQILHQEPEEPKPSGFETKLSGLAQILADQDALQKMMLAKLRGDSPPPVQQTPVITKT